MTDSVSASPLTQLITAASNVTYYYSEKTSPKGNRNFELQL